MKTPASFLVFVTTITSALSLNLPNFDLNTPLDSSRGFQIIGGYMYEWIGQFVAYGDVNADGIDDLIIAGYHHACVIYGRATGISESSDLGTPLDLARGFNITLDNPDSEIYSVSSAGDVNGDGADDVIFGINHRIDYFIPEIIDGVNHGSNPFYRRNGTAYIIYGRAGGVQSSINLGSTLDLTQGVQISGCISAFGFGCSTSSAGDVNGDGIDDVIVGVPGASPLGRILAGTAFILYGKVGGFQSHIDLNATLDSSLGFQIYGDVIGDCLGNSVSAAGDVNADGIADFILAAACSLSFGRRDFPNNNRDTFVGAAYVIYGRADGFQGNIDLRTTLSLTHGFQVSARSNENSIGIQFVSLAGDINKDGVSDVIITSTKHGSAYVIYGKTGGVQSHFDLGAGLIPTKGFRINPPPMSQVMQINSAGDVNSDGIDDIIVGLRASPLGRRDAGIACIIYGKAEGLQSYINLNTTLDPNIGFQIYGGFAYDGLGTSVTSADMNNDGIKDIILGAPSFITGAYIADPHGLQSGAVYVIYTGCTDPMCSECFDIGANSCTSCKGHYNLTDDGKCLGNSPASITPNNGCSSPEYYKYKNGSCLSFCPRPFLASLQNGAHYCNPPCASNYYLYKNKICLPSCPLGFVSKIEHTSNIPYCEQSKEISTNNDSTNASQSSTQPQPSPAKTGSVSLQLYMRYNISLFDFNSQDGLNKFIQKLAAILSIDQSLIFIIDIREGSTIIESQITLTSTPDEDSIEPAVSKAQTMGQKVSQAVSSNDLNVIDGVDILDYGVSVNVHMPTKSDETKLEVVQESTSSTSIMMKLVVVLVIIAAGFVGYLVYKNKNKKNQNSVRNQDPKHEQRISESIDHIGDYDADFQKRQAENEKLYPK